jgi:1-deoxy-D-xylulose-5-phosphate reductoisomerase
LALARQALRAGGAASAVLNAANEVAVEAFLNEQIRFGHIFETVDATLQAMTKGNVSVPPSVEALLALDGDARRVAQNYCKGLHR